MKHVSGKGARETLSQGTVYQLQLTDSRRRASQKQQTSQIMVCRVQVWLWVGQGTMFCFQSQGRRPPRQIAYSSLFSILLFSVRPPDLLPPWVLKRETEEGTLSWDTGSWGGPRYPFMHSFIVRLLSVVPGMILVFMSGIEDTQSWASRSSCSRKGR